MTEYYKQVENGYIVGVGTNGNDAVTAISAAEYAEILDAIHSQKPTPPEGYTYMLNADTLEWELVELSPEPEPELTAEEALEILLGGDGA